MCSRESYFTSTSSARDSAPFSFLFLLIYRCADIRGRGMGIEITKILLFAWRLSDVLDTVLEVVVFFCCCWSERISESPCSCRWYWVIRSPPVFSWFSSLRSGGIYFYPWYWWGSWGIFNFNRRKSICIPVHFTNYIVKSSAPQIIIHAESKKYRIYIALSLYLVEKYTRGSSCGCGRPSTFVN